jgi:hypothetical protein
MIHLFGTSHSDFLLLQLVLNPDQVGFIFRGKVPTGQLVTNDPELCLIPVVEGFRDGEGLSGVRMAEDRWGGHHRGRAGGSGVMLRDTMIKTFMDVRTGGSGGSGLSVLRIMGPRIGRGWPAGSRGRASGFKVLSYTICF